MIADVLIRGDRIEEIGERLIPPEKERENGMTVIDAAGKVVCPGFIDMHAHSDFAIPSRGGMEEKIRQGITTAVIGNCGFSAAPAAPRYVSYLKKFTGGMFGDECEFSWSGMGEYLSLIGKSLGANVVAQVGFANLRLAVVGMLASGLNEEQLRKATDMLRQALDEGARGFSTGLFYPPQSMSKEREIATLCEALKGRDAIYSTHIRNEMDDVEGAASEAIRVAEICGVPLQISHLKSIMDRNRGKVEKVVALLEDARARGVDASADVYPYNAFANIALPLILKYEKGMEDRVLFLYMKHNKEYEGKTLAQAMEMSGMGARGLVMKLAMREGLSGMPVAGFMMDESDVRFLVAHPLLSVGSDGVESFDKKTHPRLWGSFPRVIEKYCREEKLISIEECVRKMTSMPAEKLGLKMRGELKKGYFADVVVFDPENIKENTTYEDPVRFPTGIDAVIVNGEIAARNDSATAARAGRVL